MSRVQKIDSDGKGKGYVTNEIDREGELCCLIVVVNRNIARIFSISKHNEPWHFAHQSQFMFVLGKMELTTINSFWPLT